MTVREIINIPSRGCQSQRPVRAHGQPCRGWGVCSVSEARWRLLWLGTWVSFFWRRRLDGYAKKRHHYFQYTTMCCALLAVAFLHTFSLFLLYLFLLSANLRLYLSIYLFYFISERENGGGIFWLTVQVWPMDPATTSSLYLLQTNYRYTKLPVPLSL